jgi:peroxiredoxin
MEDAWRHTVAEQQGKREEAYKQKILAQQVKRPATAFKLPTVAGRTVSLHDFRGKPLVLAFWATWCGPCHGELKKLNQFMTSEERTRAALLTVSVDTEKSAVLPFAKKNGYVFPIAVSDGTIDAAYRTDNIPQLYVLDSDGNIRFHLAGYDSDGYFSKKLNWMIEAAAAPYTIRQGG